MSISTNGTAAAADVGKDHSADREEQPNCTGDNDQADFHSKGHRISVGFGYAVETVQPTVNCRPERRRNFPTAAETLLSGIRESPNSVTESHVIQDGGGSQTVNNKDGGGQGVNRTRSQQQRVTAPKVKVKSGRQQRRPQVAARVTSPASTDAPGTPACHSKTRTSAISGDTGQLEGLCDHIDPNCSCRQTEQDRMKEESGSMDPNWTKPPRTSTANGVGVSSGVRVEPRRKAQPLEANSHRHRESERQDSRLMDGDDRTGSQLSTPLSPIRRERDGYASSDGQPTPSGAYERQMRCRKGTGKEREAQRRSQKPERNRRSSIRSSESDSSRSGSSGSVTPRDRLYPRRKVVRKVRDHERRVGSRDSPGAGSRLERTMREISALIKHSKSGRTVGSSKPHGIQSYSGTVNGEMGDIPSFRVWADRYKIKWKGLGVKSDADLIDRMPLSLEGIALDEFQTLTREEKESYDACVEAMVERLEPGKNNSAEARLRLNDRAQEEGETVSHYLRTLRAMVKRAHPGVGKSGAEDILLNVFVAGLRDAIRLDVAKTEPTKVKYALQEALTVEKALSRYQRKPTARGDSGNTYSNGSSALGKFAVCTATSCHGPNCNAICREDLDPTTYCPPDPPSSTDLLCLMSDTRRNCNYFRCHHRRLFKGFLTRDTNGSHLLTCVVAA